MRRVLAAVVFAYAAYRGCTALLAASDPIGSLLGGHPESAWPLLPAFALRFFLVLVAPGLVASAAFRAGRASSRRRTKEEAR